MPSLGSDMEKGTLVEWNVAPGEHVSRGQIIAAVETDKGIIDIEVFEDGVVEELLVPIGSEALVGDVLARIVTDNASAEGVPAPAPPRKTPEPAPPIPPTDQPAVAESSDTSSVRLRITPVAQRRARELGIPLDGVIGTGGGGAITLEDIEKLAAAPPATKAPPPPVTGVDAAAMRRAIGAAMSRSKREIPHYYLGSTICMHNAMRWLADYNAIREPAERLLYAALLIKAVALALRESPELNGFWRNDSYQPGAGIHVGMAVALRGGGLVAPAIHDTDQRALPQLMADFRDLVGRARHGGLKGSEMSDATITLTSLGEQGVESILPVITPPQVAIVGFGRVVERPWVVDDALAIRPVVQASLAADHRTTDGHAGARFLNTVDHLLQNPESL